MVHPIKGQVPDPSRGEDSNILLAAKNFQGSLVGFVTCIQEFMQTKNVDNFALLKQCANAILSLSQNSQKAMNLFKE